MPSIDLLPLAYAFAAVVVVTASAVALKPRRPYMICMHCALVIRRRFFWTVKLAAKTHRCSNPAAYITDPAAYLEELKRQGRWPADG